MVYVYPCGKFCDCSFSRFGFILRTDRHALNHAQTDTTNALPNDCRRLESCNNACLLFGAKLKTNDPKVFKHWCMELTLGYPNTNGIWFGVERLTVKFNIRVGINSNTAWVRTL